MLHSSPRPSAWHRLRRALSQPRMRDLLHACTSSKQARIAGLALMLVLCMATLIVWAPWQSDALRLRAGQAGDMQLSTTDAPPSPDDPLSDDLGPPPLSHLTHLLLVAGHAVLTGTDVHDLNAPSNWALLEYQKGQVGTFVQHIRRGVELAREDEQALLVFSGGETRAQAGPRSEAQGYWTAAAHARWFAPDAIPGDAPPPPDAPSDPVSERAATEEFARDSFENLLFSLCRFREVTGRYPERITVVGFSFKEPRFRQLHRAAIRFPEERFAYEGIDPPSTEDAAAGDAANAGERDASGTPLDAAARAALLASEQSQSYVPFTKDPYSCRPPLLLKKKQRNPFRRSHAGYETGCPEMRALLRYCGTTVYPGPLPWDADEAELRKVQAAEA